MTGDETMRTTSVYRLTAYERLKKMMMMMKHLLQNKLYMTYNDIFVFL